MSGNSVGNFSAALVYAAKKAESAIDDQVRYPSPPQLRGSVAIRWARLGSEGYRVIRLTVLKMVVSYSAATLEKIFISPPGMFRKRWFTLC